MSGSTAITVARASAVSAPPAFDVTFEKITDTTAVEETWRRLERRSDGSYFRSAGWIGCWLRLLPSRFDPRLMVIRTVSEVVGLGVLIGHRHRRHGFVRTNGLHLNETGAPSHDCLTIEYNGILAHREFAAPVARCALAWLANNEASWDELYLGGLEPRLEQQYSEASAELGLVIWVQEWKRCDFVDLDAVREAGGDYLDRLSRNTRYQVRRAFRIYGRNGAPTLKAAADVEEALDYLSRLKQLHQAYWTRRGKPGAFANEFFERFHRALIRERFATGEIQLLHVAAGDRLIGYLYNFVWAGRVYNYQSGFHYEADPKVKPGLVSHCLAIAYNLNQGARIYDFMAGGSQHKASLGTEFTHMSWLVLQRDRLSLRLEHRLRYLKQRFRGRSVA